MKIERKKIESKEQLVDLIRSLSEEDPSKWQNISAPVFLEALSAWLENANGFYKNFGLETNPEVPSWQLFADALQAATIYE